MKWVTHKHYLQYTIKSVSSNYLWNLFSHFSLKGSYNATCQLFELKCVLAVCIHNNPIMIKIHPVFFFCNLVKCFPLSQAEPSDGGPSHDCWLTVAFQHRLHWCLTSDPPWVSCHQLFHRRSRCRQEWLLSYCGVLLLDVIMNIAIVIYSRHLSGWRGLRLVLKGMRPRST